MSTNEQRQNERGRNILLVPLMIASNLFLFACMLGLGIAALRGGNAAVAAKNGDTSQQAVAEYLAENVPQDSYRIRQWFPAVPVEQSAVEAGRSAPAADKVTAQRVQVVFYGPKGARQLDTVYWVQNGKVTRTMTAYQNRFSQLCGERAL